MLAIQIVNVTAGYDRHPAIHHITGEFKKGSLTAVVGPNGSGKSTLLKTIADFIKPMSGHIKFTDKPRIGYLPQISEIDRSFPLSVYDVVMMGHWPDCGLFKAVTLQQRQKAMDALAQVGMASFAARSIGALSSGQFQRVLFARLMLQNADIILLDEPFSAIDSRTAHDLLHLMEDWHRGGKTIIAVLHDMEQVKHHFPDTLVLAREVVAWGDTKTALADKHLGEAQRLSEHWHDHGAECHRDSNAGAA
mgnify:CR=1 FL=1